MADSFQLIFSLILIEVQAFFGLNWNQNRNQNWAGDCTKDQIAWTQMWEL